MHVNLVTLFVWLPDKAVWLVMKMLIIQWIAEFLLNQGHKGAVIEIENYVVLGARLLQTMVEWNCD